MVRSDKEGLELLREGLRPCLVSAGSRSDSFKWNGLLND